MTSITETSKTIDNMYSNLTYLDQYGGSVWFFVILLILLFLVVSYVTVLRNIEPIKNDWANQRCKPQIIPFAGIINKPPDMSIVEFTGKNFTNCMQNILVGVTGEAVQPITYMTKAVTEVFQAIAATMQNIRIMISSIRSSVTNIAQEIMGRLANIMVPIQQILIAFKDSMNKVKGILTAGLYTSLGTYYALKAMLGAIVQFIVIILIVLAALIVSMWIIPFTWPVAASMTAIFISVSIPLAIIITFMTDILHIKTNLSIPGVPATPNVCFHPNTLLQKNDGTYASISDIKVGEILQRNDKITAKLILDARHQPPLYEIDGILVTPEHKVLCKDKWISVKDHPHAISTETCEHPYLYCLNTASKKIVIQNTVFLDWDELDDNDMKEITRDIHIQDLHRTLDGGFTPNTPITMRDGTSRPIKDVKVGDVLSHDIQVIGIVEIDNQETRQLFHYNLGNGKTFDAHQNIHFCHPTLEESCKKIPFTNKEPILYHLVTREEVFYVGGEKCFHYNGNVELCLDKYQKKLLSMKYV